MKFGEMIYQRDGANFVYSVFDNFCRGGTVACYRIYLLGRNRKRLWLLAILPTCTELN